MSENSIVHFFGLKREDPPRKRGLTLKNQRVKSSDITLKYIASEFTVLFILLVSIALLIDSPLRPERSLEVKI